MSIKLRLSESFGPITKLDIDNLESSRSILLPESYKDFLLRNNGGRPNLNCFKTKSGEYETDIQFFWGIKKGSYSLLDKNLLLEDRLPEKAFAIANDSLGNFLFIDLITNAIYFFDHEIETGFLIADNFEEFIQSLFKVDLKKSELDIAIDKQNLLFFKEIVDRGGNLDDIKNEFGQSIIEIACLWNRAKLVQFLVNSGVKIEGGLYAACSKGYEKIVRLLLENGADPNERNLLNNNNTAISRACLGGFVEVVKLLIEYGADPKLEDIYGQTAYTLAARSNNQSLIDFLNNASNK